MAEFNHPAKDAEPGISLSNYVEDDVEQAIASPVDCWELVGSRPGSPLPEARGDALALAEASISACSSGSLLHDNYFGCTVGESDAAVLPVSTAMPDKQNDDDVRSPDRSAALVCIASDTDAIGIPTTHNELICDGDHTDNADLMSHDDGMQCDDHTHHNETYHEDLPYYDQMQHDVDVLHHHKVHDLLTMYHDELMDHDDRWRIADETHFEGIMHTEDCAHCTNRSGPPCEIVESTSVPIAHHDECAFGLSSGLESPRVSLRGMVDHDMSIPHALADGSSFNVLLEEGGTESATSQASHSQDSVHGTISIPNKRPQKGFVSISWVWTQLIRWQTQLGHANTVWSVALAAAVMGILILGRGWQRLQAQNQSLRSQLWAKEKRITQLMFQLMQTKDALAKVRRVPVICVKPSPQIPQDNF